MATIVSLARQFAWESETIISSLQMRGLTFDEIFAELEQEVARVADIVSQQTREVGLQDEEAAMIGDAFKEAFVSALFKRSQ
ncbi:hypothetical protein FZC33_01785 [Labrys sp. KNU-23]|uniref:hypothetical protein n=1 Tax=Labrys sp. KNU-23 TaxID=2789216 RepID=UPI0011EE70E5|nr:hypothetical protein [Labrys sp. KNU-23]QEN85023.1 hypothetical protein FZC33_01785 [Labrys sp. KNU-23]